jgi:hypothetical protein
VDIVENVKEVSANRSLMSFAKGLLHRPVKIKETRTAKQISSRVPKRSHGVLDERGWIEILRDHVCARAISMHNGIADEIGSVLAHTTERTILPRDDRERRPATPSQGPGGFPSTC